MAKVRITSGVYKNIIGNISTETEDPNSLHCEIHSIKLAAIIRVRRNTVQRLDDHGKPIKNTIIQQITSNTKQQNNTEDNTEDNNASSSSPISEDGIDSEEEELNREKQRLIETEFQLSTSRPLLSFVSFDTFSAEFFQVLDDSGSSMQHTVTNIQIK